MSEDYTKNANVTLSLVDAVRKRPGMYFGDINPLALNSAIYEVIANSVDQYLSGVATKVELDVSEDVIRVSDDGPGLPFDKLAPNDKYTSLAEYYLMHRHDSPTADNHAPHIHFLGGGLGLAVVNAASEYINITSSNGSAVWKQSFGRGKVLTQPVKESQNAPSGTLLEIHLDKDIFLEYKPDAFALRKAMFELAHFYPGLVVDYNGERFIARKGLLDLACIHYQNNPAGYSDEPPARFFYEGTLEGTQVQVAIIGDAVTETEYLSWVNGVPSVGGGTHVEGLKAVLQAVSWKPKIALIHVIMHDPQYANPSKDVLRNLDITNVLSELLLEPITVFRNASIR